MAREIRILHTADTHLGYKQYHSEARRKDFFAAFELVVNDAVEMQVDAVVHAGDLFDSRNPTLEDLLETMNILARLKAADIPFFGIVGNHESKQNTQWLDLFEEMGLAARLGKKPAMVGNVAIYGIDSVPKSKIPIFDYSGFEEPDSAFSTFSSHSTLPTLSTPSNSSNPSSSSALTAENCRRLLVMHQIMNPFPYAEWNCDEVLENLPFRVDAVLLGDYHEHAITKNKTGETWVTYPGSTERNSVSEKDARSYNIITLSEKGLEISKRTIPTRSFLSLQVELNGEDKPHEQIFSAVNERLEEIPGSVALLEIFGDLGTIISLSELEEYLLNKGALVSNVKDRRIKESLPEETLKVTFSDPDHAVASEIRRMSLNDGGLIIDEIVRSPNVARSRVDEETEDRLSELIEAKAMDFKSPDFRIEVASPVYLDSSVYPSNADSPVTASDFPELQEMKSNVEIGFTGKVEFAGEAGFTGKTRPAGLIAGELEITALSGVLRTSDRDENAEKSTRKSTEISATGQDNSRSTPGENFQQVSNSKSPGLPDSGSIELFNESTAPQGSNSPHKALETPEKASEAGTEFLGDNNGPEDKSKIKLKIRPENKIGINPKNNTEIKSEIKPEIKLEVKSASKSEIKLASKPVIKPADDKLPENEPEKEIQKPYEPGVKGKPEAEISGKTGKLPEEKPARATELTGKTGKAGQKKGKGKAAVPRQYNLGDYL